MSMLKSLLYCCAPFTLLASVLLFTLYGFIKHRSWTFEIIAVKQSWDITQKTRCCLNAAIFYMAISLALWILVLIDTFVLDFAVAKAEWSRCRALGEWPSLIYLIKEHQQRRRAYGRRTFSGNSATAVDVVVASAGGEQGNSKDATMLTRSTSGDTKKDITVNAGTRGDEDGNGQQQQATAMEQIIDNKSIEMTALQSGLCPMGAITSSQGTLHSPRE